MNKNTANNLENANNLNNGQPVWEVPVLYKEDWLNTLKTSPGSETPSNADGQS